MSISVETNTWRLILDTALDAVVVMDRNGKVVDWNVNATKIFGWTREQVIGRTMAEFIIPPEFREAHEAGLRHYLETGARKVLGRRIEISGLRKSAEIFPLELSISPFAEGRDLLFVGFLRDISERRNTERLRELHAIKMEVLYQTISFAAESSSFDEALDVCVAAVQKLTGWPIGHTFLPSDSEPFRLLPSPVWSTSRPEAFPKLRAVTEVTSFALGEGLPGRIWSSREPQWIADVDADPYFLRARVPGGIEIKAALGFPVISNNEVIAVVEFFSETVVQPDADLLITLQAMGQQVGRVFERRRAEQALRAHAAALEVEIEERIRAEEHQRLLLAEVNHRVKNMLAVVTAIAGQTARNSKSIENFNERFNARLQALGAAHTLLSSRNWQARSLIDLVDAVLSPYQSANQVEIDGQRVLIQPKAVVSVTMVLHELVTNAAKYGALSVPAGKLSLEWIVTSSAEPWIQLRWRETGIGPVLPPFQAGFGSAMIRACIQQDLRGRMNLTYGKDVVEYGFEFPMKQSN